MLGQLPRVLPLHRGGQPSDILLGRQPGTGRREPRGEDRVQPAQHSAGHVNHIRLGIVYPDTCGRRMIFVLVIDPDSAGDRLGEVALMNT
jgi:hypothetical protein